MNLIKTIALVGGFILVLWIIGIIITIIIGN